MKVLSFVALAALVASTAAAQQAPAKISLATGIQRGYDTIKRNLMEAAEKMPEADYGFKPTPDIRSYGQLFGHVANSQFNTCAAARGEANPNQGTDNEQKTTKAEFVKAMADSFAFCDPVYASLTDEAAMQFIRQGQNEVMRGVALSNHVAHNNEMYGVAGVYMRLKGLVPPSTERRMQR
jgi:hypothetical protein